MDPLECVSDQQLSKLIKIKTLTLFLLITRKIALYEREVYLKLDLLYNLHFKKIPAILKQMAFHFRSLTCVSLISLQSP